MNHVIVRRRIERSQIWIFLHNPPMNRGVSEALPDKRHHAVRAVQTLSAPLIRKKIELTRESFFLQIRDPNADAPDRFMPVIQSFED